VLINEGLRAEKGLGEDGDKYAVEGKHYRGKYLEQSVKIL